MSVPDAPGDLAFEVGKSSVTLSVERAAHPLSAVYGAAYTFLDRCYVFLAEDGARTRITLTWKSGEAEEGVLRGIGEELVDELVSCTWRAGIVEATRDLVSSANARAHGAATPSLDDLERYEFGDAGAAFDDPLGIAMSWEDKYAKKKSAADPAAPADGKKEGD
jgi:His-Xaa-Ser system protein HxsD